MLQRWRHSRRCRRLARVCQAPVLSRYLEGCSRQKIGTIADTPMIAVDLELTGLDVSEHQIISMGWTQVDGGRLRMGSNRHLLISAARSVGKSAAIHELLDSEVARGAELEAGLEALFDAAGDRLWVFHHAGLDISFLKRACRQWAGVVPGFIVLDTMRIEYRLRRRREVPVKQGDLKLGRIRKNYGLPDYRAHNALIDAVATAELMLASAARMEPDAPFYASLGLSYRMMDQYEEAIAAYKKAINIWPEYVYGYIGLTASYSQGGRMEEARAQAEEVLKINPEFTLEGIERSGYLNYRKADKERFISALKKAGLK